MNTEIPVGRPVKYSIISPIPPSPPERSPAGTKNLTTANEQIKSPISIKKIVLRKYFLSPKKSSNIIHQPLLISLIKYDNIIIS